MPLPAMVDTLDRVPEAIRGEYEARDGKYVLRLEGDPPGYIPTTIHKQKLDDLDHKLRDREAVLAKYKGIDDPEETRQKLAELQALKDKKLIDTGKIDELVNQRVQRFTEQTEQRIGELTKAVEQTSGERDTLKSELSQLLLGRLVEEAALSPRHKVLPQALRIVSILAQHGDQNGVRWTLDEHRKPVAVRADGQPAWSAKDATKQLEIDEWMEGVIRAHPQIVPRSSGGSAPGSTASGGNGPDIMSLPPAERINAARRLTGT